VFVPADRIVGKLDGGWAVAMHILSSERGTYAWFRHSFLFHQLLEHLDCGNESSDTALGNAWLDLVAASAAGHDGLLSHSAGVPLGPRAAFTKLLLGGAEQSVQDFVLAGDADLAVGAPDARTAIARQEYLFSRIVTVYGGSQQMQLETIAKQILRLP
jgi:alkylation response protein AidB-like acyl-CoA dehydrogenase